jgi:hypothetical protein
VSEQPGAKADQCCADGEQQQRFKRRGEHNGAECGEPDHGPHRGKSIRIGTTAKRARGQAKTAETASRQHGAERRRGANR